MDEEYLRIQEPGVNYTNPILSEETFTIRGAIFEVYRELGCGFVEGVYQEALENEFVRQNIPFKTNVPLPVIYKGERLKHVYIPDFICFDSIILELKAVEELGNDHRAQLHNYLKASGLKLGLLVNFGHYPKVDIERIIM